MGKQSVAWDIGYDDYFEGNGANPFDDDIHLAQCWFEGWEAARQTEVERRFEDEMKKVAPKIEPVGLPVYSHDFWGPGGRSTTQAETQSGNKILGWMGLGENRETGKE